MNLETGFSDTRSDIGSNIASNAWPKFAARDSDLRLLKRLKGASLAAEIAGRALLCWVPGLPGWLAGTSLVAFHFSLEAQLNHSIMHGSYASLPGAGRFTPDRYETWANPFRSATWRDAHRVHHGNPSLLNRDPDTVHPLFRVDERTPWRVWHALNSFVGAFLTFECWAFDYDRFLKNRRMRERRDRRELLKLAFYVAYQFGFFAMLAGPRWRQVLGGTLVAVIMRNLVFTGLQTASSVGADVSTSHAGAATPPRGENWFRFQVETSKNFVIRSRFWRLVCGGLDRHIEHHLYPALPPNRLHEISPLIRAHCLERGYRYAEFPSFAASLRDSIGYLRRLGRRPHRTSYTSAI